MFGIYMVVLYIIARIIKAVGIKAGEVRRRNEAIKNGSSFYLDRNYTKIRVSDDVPFEYRRIDGDLYEINPYTHHIKRNISEERRQKTEKEQREKAIKEGKRMYEFEPRDTMAYLHFKEKVEGIRYKDIETGNICVKRKKCCKDWYVNVETGMYEYCDPEKLKDGKEHWFKTIDGKDIMAVYSDELLENERIYFNNNQIKWINKGYGDTLWQ